MHSVGDNYYEYSKLVRKDPRSIAGTTTSFSAQSLSQSKIRNMEDNIVFDDTSSFENQYVNPEKRFNVVAPSGNLGVVIDTPDLDLGGIPVVHMIKETSPIFGQVEAGDRLLSVDGEDCMGMTAAEVSRLITMKKEKPARVLNFVRYGAPPQDLPEYP